MSGEHSQPSWFWNLLACPQCRGTLGHFGSELKCAQGHGFPVLDGIPVLVTDGLPATHPAVAAALELARGGRGHVPPPRAEGEGPAVDPYVAQALAGTCGHMYRKLPGGLARYPLPRLPLPAGEGRTFVDIGSGWGRWALAAARVGFRACCVDPSLEMLQAARRVARQLGVEVGAVVGDGRRLPLSDRVSDVVFSYSVLQHFSKDDARLMAMEMARVCRAGGTLLVQMPNRNGLRNRWHMARQAIGIGASNPFRVRYWALDELKTLFAPWANDVVLSVDGFLSLNPRLEDLDLLARRYRAVVRISEFLRRRAVRWRFLLRFADSVWVQATRR